MHWIFGKKYIIDGHNKTFLIKSDWNLFTILISENLFKKGYSYTYIFFLLTISLEISAKNNYNLSILRMIAENNQNNI